MLDESELEAEGFSAFAAFVRPGASVNPVVLNEVVALAEGFPTFVTLVRPRFWVSSRTVTKDGALVKRLLTVIPVVVTFSGVQLLMLEKFTVIAKGLPVVAVLGRTFSTLKGVPMFKAAVRLGSFESGLVSEKAHDGQEVLPNSPTGERLP